MSNPEVITREVFLAELEKIASGVRDLHIIVDAGAPNGAGKKGRRVKPVHRESTGSPSRS